MYILYRKGAKAPFAPDIMDIGKVEITHYDAGNSEFRSKLRYDQGS